MGLVSSVYHMANGAPPVGRAADERNAAARAEAWQRHGLAVIDPEDIDDDWLRRAIIGYADRRFGRRTGRSRSAEYRVTR